MPIGRSANNYRVTGWRMTLKAIEALDEWTRWFRTGQLDADSDLGVLNDLLGDRGAGTPQER